MILMRMMPMMKCGIIVTSSLSCLTRVTLSPINNTTPWKKQTSVQLKPLCCCLWSLTHSLTHSISLFLLQNFHTAGRKSMTPFTAATMLSKFSVFVCSRVAACVQGSFFPRRTPFTPAMVVMANFCSCSVLSCFWVSLRKIQIEDHSEIESIQTNWTRW